MTELAPCPSCQRHVAVRETRCPFCATALAGLRAMHRIPGRLARAAAFSAALVACSDKKPVEPPPAPAGSAQGSDDLEQMLDHAGTTVEQATPRDASLADATTDADVDAAIDAGTAIDAGLSQEELDARELQRKKWREQKRREQEEERKRRLDHINVKPYGAPPARRRIV